MRTGPFSLSLACALALAGCPSQPMPPTFDDASGGGDAASVDGGMPTDGGTPDDTGTPNDAATDMDGGTPVDGGTPDDAASPVDAAMPIDAFRPDSGGLPGTSDPAPPATIVHTGTANLILRGTILTPSGPLVGELLIVGNTIQCVAADCSGTTGAGTATIIDTHATISPGLIDGHNHLTYDFLGEWMPPHLYGNRYQWRNDASYSAWVDPEGDSDNNGTQDTGAQCPGAKWGELRSIIHGTTTVQGQSPQSACLDRLARNADHYHGLGPDRTRTTISGPCESGFPTRTSLLGDFTSGATTRLFLHMGEGYMNSGSATRTNPLREFDCYDGTDAMFYNGAACTSYTTMATCVADTDNRCAWTGTCATTGMSLLENAAGTPYGTSVFIHAMPLTPAQLDRTLHDDARVVWSPSSNIVLYGQTADIQGMLERGITVGLGPDWTPSGSDEMLSEMRFAQDYGQSHAVPELTAEQIWRMATIDGADVVGLSPIGTIAVGQRADISVFGRTSADPYQAVIDSRAADVRLVLIDGVGYYGDVALQATTAVNSSCEAFDACGTPKYLCAANTPGNMTASARANETVADIHGQLLTILGTYSRQADLLELVDCSL